MSDEELKRFIPLHGDRVRTRNFVKQQNKEVASSERRKTLFEVLREKIEDRRAGTSKRENKHSVDDKKMRPVSSEKLIGNRNASKKTRMVEIGWVHKEGDKNVQVRKKKGGGTRRVQVLKNATRLTLIDESKKLFFLEGMSTKGREDELEYELWDYKDRVVKEGVTVKEMYDETKIPMLRFYLITRRKDVISEELDINEIDSDTVTRRSDQEVDLVKHRKSIEEEAKREDPREENKQIMFFQQNANPSSDYETLSMVNPQYVAPYPPLNIFDEDSQENTTPHPDGDAIHTTTPVHEIKVHRGMILRELISAFYDIDPLKDIIEMQMLMPNGEAEAAEDAGGVTRDILTEFWGDFYDQSTMGQWFKIPYLRHDYGEREWKSIAKIIVFGWRKEGYFPIQISDVFMQYCIFGRCRSDVLTSFLSFLPESNSSLLQSAMSDIDGVDSDELLELLQEHEVKTMPKRSNIVRIVREIAHKELIQTPMFVIDCWNPVLMNMKDMTEDKLASLYTDLQPTTRKVLSLLKFADSLSPDEVQVSNHLRRFIRELDQCALKRFLRFCTGSDILIKSSIEISFVNVSGLARGPVAHTCSCLLELPKSYENFPQFRTEFLSVLNANVWVMDII